MKLIEKVFVEQFVLMVLDRQFKMVTTPTVTPTQAKF